MRGGGDDFVGAWPSAELVQGLVGLGDGVGSDFGTCAGGGEDGVGGDGIVIDGSDKVFGPLLDGGGFCVDPIQVRLDVAVGVGNVSDVDAEEDVAAVVGPVQAGFDGLIVGDSVGLGSRLPGAAAKRANRSEFDGVDFDVVGFFLALVNGIGNK